MILALAFVIGAFFDADVSIHAALRPLLLVLVTSAALTTLAVMVLGPTRGPIVVAAGFLIARSGDLLHVAASVLLVTLIVAAWLLARRIVRKGARLQHPTLSLNALSAFLMLGVVISAFMSGAIWRMDMRQGQSFANDLAIGSSSSQGRPDMYFILLDGYPRADTLERLFDYDNSPFLIQLRARGFDVAEASSSNYMYTAMTLASMLHMQYVQDLPRQSVAGTPYGVSLRSDINTNPVWTRLRSLGYQIAANQPPWENVAMRTADLFCGDQINDFELFLLRTSLIGHVVNLLDPSFEGDQHRAIINRAFECLGQASAPAAAPRAVFIHVGGPHLPIVFTGSGGPAELDVFGHTAQELPVTHERFVTAYTAELEYLNRRVLDAIDQLLQRPDQPIVVVWSDHGSESNLNWGDAAMSDLAERFSNLFAALTPSRPNLFPSDITPVNVFAMLFDAYFGTDLPGLTPRHFVSPADEKLDFTEVPDPDIQP
ncbi:MAG: hypothetical protein WED12_06145 [Chloroflexota bacterium]